jgi:capreomycidine synthase
MNHLQTIAPADLENWLREHYFTTKVDIGSSGVQNYSFSELRGLIGLTQEEIDEVVLDDGRSLGSPGLRRAIAVRWGDGDPERVMVTHGSSEAILLVMQSMLRPGDEVIVLEPCYYALRAIAESIRCKLKVWKLRYEDGFVPEVAEIRKLLSHRTRMVIVNFPHNPTGASLTAEKQKELIDLAAEAGAYLVWDRAFAELTYDCPPLPDPTLLYDRSISLGTLSKAYGLAGLRIGWLIAAPDVIARCVYLRDYTTVFLSPLVELIAQRAVEQAASLLDRRLSQAAANLHLLTDWIGERPGLTDWVRPQGGVTVFPRFSEIIDTDALCQRLAANGVLLVPGSCFHRPRHVRLGFGGPTDAFRRGLASLSGQISAQATIMEK